MKCDPVVPHLSGESGFPVTLQTIIKRTEERTRKCETGKQNGKLLSFYFWIKGGTDTVTHVKRGQGGRTGDKEEVG